MCNDTRRCGAESRIEVKNETLLQAWKEETPLVVAGARKLNVRTVRGIDKLRLLSTSSVVGAGGSTHSALTRNTVPIPKERPHSTRLLHRTTSRTVRRHERERENANLPEREYARNDDDENP